MTPEAAAAIALGRVGRPSDIRVRAALLNALKDRNRRVREAACLGMGLLGGPDLRLLLLELAQDTPRGRDITDRKPSPLLNGTRMFACVAIGISALQTQARQDDPVLSALVTLAKTPTRSLSVQVGALLAIPLFKQSSVVPEVLDIYTDATRPPLIQAHAGLALGKLKSRSAIPALKAGLTNPCARVTRASASSLGLLTKPTDAATVKALISSATHSPDVWTRGHSLIALGEIGHPHARDFLFNQIGSLSTDDRAFAALALGITGMKDPAQITRIGPVLLKAWHTTTSHSAREAVTLSLGLLGFQPASKPLRDTLTNLDGHHAFASRLCIALGFLQDSASLPAIRRNARLRKDYKARSRAILALGMLEDEAALPLLEETLSQSTNGWEILGAVATVLGKASDARYVPFLLQYLQTATGGSIGVSRAFATVALGFAANKSAQPLLTQALSHNTDSAWVGRLIELMSIL